MWRNFIDDLLQKYYSEASTGITTQKSPSQLTRGEGLEAEYFIFKIDLCGSTKLLKRKLPKTYLKFAHVFLSTIDHITRYFGADGNQAEYAGDSVLAYFPVSKVQSFNVLKAAFLSKHAVIKMNNLDATLNRLTSRTRIVIHHGKLIISRIGPWGDGDLIAIGRPLHTVGHLEKKIGAGVGWATREYAKYLKPKDKRIFLLPKYDEKKVEVPPKPQPRQTLPESPFNSLVAALSGYKTESNFSNLASLFGNAETSRLSPQYELVKELKGYSINWTNLKRYFLVTPNVMSN